MISFNKKMELLADLSINYEYLSDLDEDWKKFFERNNLALPFCALIYLGLCNFPQKKDNKDRITNLIYETFYDLWRFNRGSERQKTLVNSRHVQSQRQLQCPSL